VRCLVDERLELVTNSRAHVAQHAGRCPDDLVGRDIPGDALRHLLDQLERAHDVRLEERRLTVGPQPVEHARVGLENALTKLVEVLDHRK